MPLPITDSVARTCRASQCDGGKPTTAAFELRYGEQGHEASVSVNWLEFLHPEPAEYSAKLATLRTWLLARPPGDVKPTKLGALAVVPVAAIQGKALTDAQGIMDCCHSPRFDGDPHASVTPSPGVETWPLQSDAPGRLAVQQLLYLAMTYWEPGKLETQQHPA